MVGLLSSVSLFDRERGREVVGTKLSPAQRERERVESSLMVCEEEAASNSLFSVSKKYLHPRLARRSGSNPLPQPDSHQAA